MVGGSGARRRWACVPVVGFAAGVLALSACSSGSVPSGSKAGTTSSSAAQLTGSTIKVGVIASLSGTGASNTTGLPQVVAAWEKWTNAHGGINGHPVDVIVDDDQSNPVTGLTAAKQLVQQDKVVALTALQGSYSETAFASYLQQVQVPVVGGASYDTAIWLTNPMFFNIFPAQATSLYGPELLAHQQGLHKSVAVVCAETPSCKGLQALISPYASQLGVTLLPIVTAGATQPSYAAQCLQLKSEGAQAVTLGLASSVMLRVIQNCSQQGYTPSFYSEDGVSLTDSFKSLGAHIYGWVETLPWFYQGSARNDMTAALDQYGGGASSSQYANDDAGMTWASLEMFKEALRDAPATVTSKTVLDGLYTIKNETLGGLLPQPVTFSQATQAAPRTDPACIFLIEAKNGSWDMPDGTKPVCRPVG